jgi:predicted methyltransferase
MTPPRPTELAQSLLRDTIHEGDTVIDATAGNGHDTVFLAECVGDGGRVLAFDLQEKAIQATRHRVKAAGYSSRIGLFNANHATMAAHAAPGTVSAVMFNLGYLPGEDHAVTTETADTRNALAAAATLLKPGGSLSVVCYPGHPEGAVEAREVEAWLTGQCNDGWKLAKYAMLGTIRPAPFLLAARKPD